MGINTVAIAVKTRTEILVVQDGNKKRVDSMLFVNACQSGAAAVETGATNGQLRKAYEGLELPQSPARTLADDGCRLRKEFGDCVTTEDFLAALKERDITTIRGLRELGKKEKTDKQIGDAVAEAMFAAQERWAALTDVQRKHAERRLQTIAAEAELKEKTLSEKKAKLAELKEAARQLAVEVKKVRAA